MMTNTTIKTASGKIVRKADIISMCCKARKMSDSAPSTSGYWCAVYINRDGDMFIEEGIGNGELVGEDITCVMSFKAGWYMSRKEIIDDLQGVYARLADWIKG